MRSQRIFITGASSSLMSGLLRELNEAGNEIIGLSRNARSSKLARFIKGDLEDASSWQEELKTCDILIHAAAITHSHDPQEYFKINTEATKKLIDLWGVEKPFVFISSRTAGMKSGAYGKSKRDAEQYLKEHHKKYLILSPAEVFKTDKEEGIESLIQDALNNKFIPYPAGIPSPLCPIHIDDLLREISRHMNDVDHWPREAILLNGPESFSYKSMIQACSEVAGKKPFLIPIPRVIMQVLAQLARLFPGKLPFTSDQVARLYAVKPSIPSVMKMKGVREYVKEKCA